jgi:hypothetical protein
MTDTPTTPGRILETIDPEGRPITARSTRDYLVVRNARRLHYCHAHPAARSPKCAGAILEGDTYVEALDERPVGANPFVGRRYCGPCALHAFTPDGLEILTRADKPTPLVDEAGRKTLSAATRDLERLADRLLGGTR